jgi:RNA polymerase sigma-70 factor (ECF subfamily)
MVFCEQYGNSHATSRLITDVEGAIVDDERSLIGKLKARNEEAFTELVQRYDGYLLPLATLYVSDKAVAQEVVQEAWLAVLQGIDRFQARASFKTWLSRIVMNLARTRGTREKRTVAFSQFVEEEADGSEPAVDASRFRIASQEFPGHWSVAPRPWNSDPETQLLTNETMAVLDNAVGLLPEAQRLVLTMRDVSGWTAEEVCNALDISETNQRVLLHRARSRVRAVLENYYSNPGKVFRDRTRTNLQGIDGADNRLPRETVAASRTDEVRRAFAGLLGMRQLFATNARDYTVASRQAGLRSPGASAF